MCQIVVRLKVFLICRKIPFLRNPTSQINFSPRGLSNCRSPLLLGVTRKKNYILMISKFIWII
jgi:hypothetical protein